MLSIRREGFISKNHDRRGTRWTSRQHKNHANSLYQICLPIIKAEKISENPESYHAKDIMQKDQKQLTTELQSSLSKQVHKTFQSSNFTPKVNICQLDASQVSISKKNLALQTEDSIWEQRYCTQPNINESFIQNNLEKMLQEDVFDVLIQYRGENNRSAQQKKLILQIQREKMFEEDDFSILDRLLCFPDEISQFSENNQLYVNLNEISKLYPLPATLLPFIKLSNDQITPSEQSLFFAFINIWKQEIPNKLFKKSHMTSYKLRNFIIHHALSVFSQFSSKDVNFSLLMHMKKLCRQKNYSQKYQNQNTPKFQTKIYLRTLFSDLKFKDFYSKYVNNLMQEQIKDYNLEKVFIMKAEIQKILEINKNATVQDLTELLRKIQKPLTFAEIKKIVKEARFMGVEYGCTNLIGNEDTYILSVRKNKENTQNKAQRQVKNSKKGQNSDVKKFDKIKKRKTIKRLKKQEIDILKKMRKQFEIFKISEEKSTKTPMGLIHNPQKVQKRMTGQKIIKQFRKKVKLLEKFRKLQQRAQLYNKLSTFAIVQTKSTKAKTPIYLTVQPSNAQKSRFELF